MNYKKITEDYYSKWIGEEDVIYRRGIHFIYSSERNKKQEGYTKQFDLWIWRELDNIIVSYGENAKSRINLLKSKLSNNTSIETLVSNIEQVYEKKPAHQIKYVFEKAVLSELKSRELTKDDYFMYLDFFKKNNPNCMITDWVREYFNEMIGLCFGVFVNDVLVCCADLPSMPFMKDLVQEIGINTLYEYTGNGYAKDSCIMCANELIKLGKCPQWSTGIDNIASQHVAEKVGFVKLADVFYVTLSE